ncbi:MAG: peroxiredoxin, partial [Pseudomonadota bacterium]
MLKPGTQAPSFSLPDADGEPVTLEDLIAEGPLVLYFYPADFTPGCTKEACAIRDIHDDLIASGLRIVGVSPQDGDSHQRFAARHTLPFPLLSDPDKTAVRAYDVDGPLGFGVRRGTYLIDGDGVIVDAVMADIAIARSMNSRWRAMA